MVFVTRPSTWSEWLGLVPSSERTTVGIVVLNPPFEGVPSGAYLWHMPAGETRVTLARLDSVSVAGSRVVVRRCARPPDALALQQVHREASAPNGPAFVALALTRLGLLAHSTDWSGVRPTDLASGARRLAWIGQPYGADELVPSGEWASMVARRAPLFDDHRACLAKAAAQRLEARGARVTHPADTEPSFAVEGRGGRATVLVPASGVNRARYEAHMPLFYELAQEGGLPVTCTEAELLALAL
jgi:hypothetical protein